MLQDLPFIYRKWPDLAMFGSPFFKQNWSTFRTWCACQFENEHSRIGRSISYGSDFDDTTTLLGKAFDEISKAQQALQKDLEEKLSLILLGQQTINRKLDVVLQKLDGGVRHCSTVQAADATDRKDEAYKLMSLPKLSDLCLRDVWSEYYKGFEINGRTFKALKSLERKRKKHGKIYRHPRLKSTIRRRRIIAEYVDSKRTKLGNLKRALKEIGKEMVEMGSHRGKKTISLNALADFLDNRRAALQLVDSDLDE